MIATIGRKALQLRLADDEAATIKRKAGFTLLEVAIAGAILMGGLAILAQLVRTTLSSSTPGFTEGVQVGPLVEQQMRLLAAYNKAYYKGRLSDSSMQSFGAVNINARGATRSYILPPLAGYAGQTYALTEQEITAKLTLTSTTSPNVNDPLVGYTCFWKLEVHHPSTPSIVRTGL